MTPRPLLRTVAGLLLLTSSLACWNRKPVEEGLPTEFGERLNSAGLDALSTGDYENAKSLFERAYASFRGLDERAGQARALYNLGLVEREIQENPSRARELFVEAEKIFEELDLEVDRARVQAARASLLAGAGQHAKALALLKQAIEASPKALLPEVLSELALARLAAGDLAGAEAAAFEALRRSRHDGELRSDALYALARVRMRQGRGNEAELQLEESLEIDRRLGRRPQIAASLELLATLLESIGRREEAAGYRERAAGVRDALENPLESETPGELPPE